LRADLKLRLDQFKLLEPYLTPRSVFLHVEAGDGALAIHVAGYVERVYAVGLSGRFPPGARLPVNLRFGWPPPGKVDVAFSERLDRGRAEEIRACLAPGGKYLVFAPLPRRGWLPRLLFRRRLVAAAL